MNSNISRLIVVILTLAVGIGLTVAPVASVTTASSSSSTAEPVLNQNQNYTTHDATNERNTSGLSPFGDSQQSTQHARSTSEQRFARTRTTGDTNKSRPGFGSAKDPYNPTEETGDKNESTQATNSTQHEDTDPYEPNDDISEATSISSGTELTAEIDQGRFDYYAIQASEGDRISATITFDHTDADIDLFLIDENQNLLDSSASVTDDEAVEAVVSQSGTYYIVVYGYSGGPAQYSLTASVTDTDGSTLEADRYEPNDNFDEATSLTEGEYQNLTITNNDVDFYAVDLTAGDNIEAQIHFDHNAADLDLLLYDPDQNFVAAGDSITDDELVSRQDVSQSGQYYLIVFAVDGNTAAYDLTLDVADSGELSSDRFEPNDVPDTSVTVEPRRISNLTLPEGDIDAFNVELAQGDSLQGEVIPVTSVSDQTPISIEIYYQSEPGAAVEFLTGHPIDEGPVSVENVDRAGIYHVVVFNNGADGIRYDLQLSSDTSTELAADRFEPNDAPDTSVTVQPRRISNLTLPPGDIDAFNVELAQGDSLQAAVIPETSVSDQTAISVEIYYQSEPGAAVEFLTGHPIDEGPVSVENVDRAGIYHVVVFNDGPDGLRYGLDISTDTSSAENDDQFEPNDNASTAAPITPGTYTDLLLATNEYDAFTVNVSEGNQLTTTVTFPNTALEESDGVTLAYYYQADSEAAVEGPLTHTAVTGTEETLTIDNVSRTGIYHIALYNGGDQSVEYTLSVDTGQRSGGGSGDNDTATDGVAVSLDPAEQRVTPDGTTTYDVVVTNATRGIGSYEFVVTSSDPSVATITDITPQGLTSSSLVSTQVANDGSSATVVASNTDTGTGTVTAMSVTIRGEARGTTTLDLRLRNGNAPAGESGNPYNVSTVSGATINVTESVGPGDLTGNGEPATDPDGDGVFEDINGDGSVTAADVTALFDLLVSGDLPADQSTLDINDQNDGVTAADVTAMFNALLDGQVP